MELIKLLSMLKKANVPEREARIASQPEQLGVIQRFDLDLFLDAKTPLGKIEQAGFKDAMQKARLPENFPIEQLHKGVEVGMPPELIQKGLMAMVKAKPENIIPKSAIRKTHESKQIMGKHAKIGDSVEADPALQLVDVFGDVKTLKQHFPIQTHHYKNWTIKNIQKIQASPYLKFLPKKLRTLGFDAQKSVYQPGVFTATQTKLPKGMELVEGAGMIDLFNIQAKNINIPGQIRGGYTISDDWSKQFESLLGLTKKKKKGDGGMSDTSKTINLRNILKPKKSDTDEFGNPLPTPKKPGQTVQVHKKTHADPTVETQIEGIVKQIVKEEKNIIGYDNVSGKPIYEATVKGAVVGTSLADQVMHIPSQPELMAFPRPQPLEQDQGITGTLFDITSGLGELPTVFSDVSSGLATIKPTQAEIPTSQGTTGSGLITTTGSGQVFEPIEIPSLIITPKITPIGKIDTGFYPFFMQLKDAMYNLMSGGICVHSLNKMIKDARKDVIKFHKDKLKDH